MTTKLYRVSAVSTVLLVAATPTWSFSFVRSNCAGNHVLPRPKLSAAGPSSARRKFSYLYNSKSTTFASETKDDKNPPIFETFLQGVRRDYSMRLPHYKSDVTDGINTQCLAATLFLFFACLAPAVGFGTLFGAATNGAIGTMEMAKILHAVLPTQPQPSPKGY